MSIRTINIISFVFAGLSVLLIIFGCFAPLVFTQCEGVVDFSETGQIGDTIGGSMGPIVAIAGVFMTFIAFLMQVNANRIQSEQLKKSFSMKLLENKIDSRNALELLNIDIKVMIKDVDITCNEIDTFCDRTLEIPTGEFQLLFTPKLSRSRYQTIDRNLVFRAFSSFGSKDDCIKDFKEAYSIMDYYYESLGALYDVIYKPYTDDIIKIKNQIPDGFSKMCDSLTNHADNSDIEVKMLVKCFKSEIDTRLIRKGILNVFELSKAMEDGRFTSLYDAIPNEFHPLQGLINSLIAQNKMLVKALKDAKNNLKEDGIYDRLIELENGINIMLQNYTVESLQNEFEKA